MGVGSALSTTQDNSNFFLEIEQEPIPPSPSSSGAVGDDQFGFSKRYMFDCGTTAPKLWHRAYGSVPIDGILLTHTHADHSGGIEEILFYNKYVQQGKALPIYAHEQVAYRTKTHVLKDVAEDLYDFRFHKCDLHSFIHGNHDDLMMAEVPELNAIWIKTDHMEITYPVYPAAAFSFKVGDLVGLISGDTKFNASLFDKEFWLSWYGKELPDFILHEVQFYEQENPVHTLYSELCKLPSEVKERMMLYHFSDYDKDVREDGFLGYAHANHITKLPLIEYDSETNNLIINHAVYVSKHGRTNEQQELLPHTNTGVTAKRIEKVQDYLSDGSMNLSYFK